MDELPNIKDIKHYILRYVVVGKSRYNSSPRTNCDPIKRLHGGGVVYLGGRLLKNTLNFCQFKVFFKSDSDLQEKLTLEGLVKRAGFKTFRQFGAELESRGFRRLSDVTLSAWRNGTWRPKLLAKETLIICQTLGCSLEELATAVEDYTPEDQN